MLVSFPIPEISPTISQLVSEALLLPPPQDLRCILFSLGAIQYATLALQKDIFELRKKYILSLSTTYPLQLHITFNNGISVTFLNDLCYSMVIILYLIFYEYNSKIIIYCIGSS